MSTVEAMTPPIEPATGAVPKRWTRREYVRLFRLGMLGDQRVELIGGEIEIESPQLEQHAGSISLTQKALEAAFGDGYWVRIQATLNLSVESMPDPDLSIRAGGPRGTGRTYAKTALLVVEVSDSTLYRDRGRKANLYASAGIADYWIVNLLNRQLEIYRDPQPDATQRFGYGYAQRTTLKPGATASPLAKPDAAVRVDDLLP